MDDELTALAVTRLAKLAASDAVTDWLIDGLWAGQAVGCIGGTPKAGKTWLALEMAVAVASGRPCLGRFPVPKRGPVLLYCAEDGPSAVRQRVEGLARARGVEFARLAVGWLEADGLRLDDPRHQRRLAMTVAQVQPRLVILDPLVRLHRGDENSAGDIAEVLGFLRTLQRQYATAVVLVHHVRKSGASQPGQALRGSGDLHAWGDSNLYLLRRDGRPTLIAEHRGHRAPDPIAVRLDGDPPRLVVDDLPDAQPSTLDDRVLAALADGPLTRTALRDALGVRNETLGAALDRLVDARRLIRTAAGLAAVPVPT